MEKINPLIADSIRSELAVLDKDMIKVDGSTLRPSQCFRVEFDPVHVLFNTNCPDALREKVQSILDKYIPADEGRA
jgi:hypothetical protein